MTSRRSILLLCALTALGQDFNLTTTEAARLEKTLEKSPEDLAARQRLLGYYAGRLDSSSRGLKLHHIEWLIEHHSDSLALNHDSAALQPSDVKPPFDGDLAAISAAWRQQAEEHPDDVQVLANAVKVLYHVNYGLTSDCLKRLRQIDPTDPRWVVDLASLYGSAITSSADLSRKAMTDLEASTDLPVIGLTGQGLYGMGQKAHAEPLARLGESLLRKAQSLDPLNPRWSTTASEKPVLLTERDMWPYGKVPPIPAPDEAMHLAPESQAARLMHRVQPECTPGPNVACPSKPATQKLDALIGKDGRVKSLWAASGDLSTIPAAMDAVRQWTYKPMVVTGEPVEIVTRIEVTFTPRGSFTPPVALTKVEADYSPEAHAAKFEGSVQISLVVDEHGLPRDLKVVHGVGMGLDEKALEAVRKWTFRPGTKDGKPIAVPATVEVQFKAH